MLEDILIHKDDPIRFLKDNNVDSNKIHDYLKEDSVKGFKVRKFNYNDYFNDNCFKNINEPYPKFVKKLWDCFNLFVRQYIETFSNLTLNEIIPVNMQDNIYDSLRFKVKDKNDLIEILTIIIFQNSVGHSIACGHIFDMHNYDIGQMHINKNVHLRAAIRLQVRQYSYQGFNTIKELFPLLEAKKFENNSHQNIYNLFQESLLKVESEILNHEDSDKYTCLLPSKISRVIHT